MIPNGNGYRDWPHSGQGKVKRMGNKYKSHAGHGKVIPNGYMNIVYHGDWLQQSDTQGERWLWAKWSWLSLIDIFSHNYVRIIKIVLTSPQIDQTYCWSCFHDNSTKCVFQCLTERTKVILYQHTFSYNILVIHTMVLVPTWDSSVRQETWTHTYTQRDQWWAHHCRTLPLSRYLGGTPVGTL